VVIAVAAWYCVGGRSNGLVPHAASARVVEIDQMLSTHTAAMQQTEGLGKALSETSGPMAAVASLSPAIDQINIVRNHTVTVGTGSLVKEVNVWSLICKVSPGASALDVTITELSVVVGRAKELLAFCNAFERSRSQFHKALDEVRREATAENVAALEKSAVGFKESISIADGHLAALDANLAALHRALATSREVLLRIEYTAVRPSAQTLAGLLARPVTVTQAAAGAVSQYRAGLDEAMAALSTVAGKAGELQK
jgi:hypothetical protein